MYAKEEIYKKAYTELNEVINILSDNEKSKIPNELIKNLQDNMDKEYKFKFDISKGIFEQNYMVETKALIVELYERFLAPEEEKEFWKKYDRMCLKKIEAEKQKKYSKETLFKSSEGYKTNEDRFKKMDALILAKKENVIIKIINKLKKILKG